MPSTDFNGETIVILSCEEARWLSEFITRHWDVDEDCIILRRVSRKAREATNEIDAKNRKG